MPLARRPRGVRRALWVAACTLASPYYAFRARAAHVPGVHLRGRCLRLAARVLGRGGVSPGLVHMIAFWPFDSTRYFEFDFAWSVVHGLRQGRLLDVASPRLLPLLAAGAHDSLNVVALNPDRRDMALTETLVAAAGWSSRVTCQATTIEEADWRAGQFDLITALSVIEHIPDPRIALRRMWTLLRPGGRLVLTLPVAPAAVTQVIDEDPYGLGPPLEDGHYFFQHLYDARLLQAYVYEIVGQPVRAALMSERAPGALRANLQQKADLGHYPYWREPLVFSELMMPVTDLGALRGEGVIGLEFHKHAD